MKTAMLAALGLALSPVVAGCGQGAGTQPGAMSAAEHEAAASEEEQAIERVAGTEEKCVPGEAGEVTCWTSETSTTEAQRKEAERHRELAAKHRAASASLRAAEASACAGIPEEDRDLSPFAHREDIRSVSPLREQVKLGKTVSERTAGAEVVFRAVPGMTAEWLQRVVDCHLARNAAIGYEQAAAEMAYCPLTLRGAQATVRSVGDGFAVDIRAKDDATSKEILRRAEALRGSSGASQ